MPSPDDSSDNSPPSSGHRGFPDFLAAAKEVATTSVMSPIQWMLAIIAAATVPTMIFVPDLRWAAFAVFAAAVAYAGFAFDYFRRKSPDRLQSEKYRYAQSRLKHESKLLLDDRNRGNPKVLDTRPVSNSHFTTDEAMGFLPGGLSAPDNGDAS